MVAAQGEHAAAGGEDARRMRLDGRRGFLRLTVVEGAVAVVDHCQVVEGIELPRIVPGPGHLHRGGTDRPRAEAATGAVGGGGVEGYAADYQVDAAQIAAVATAHEAGDAGVGGFRRGAVEAVAGDRLVVVVGLVHIVLIFFIHRSHAPAWECIAGRSCVRIDGYRCAQPILRLAICCAPARLTLGCCCEPSMRHALLCKNTKLITLALLNANE
ncbi:hypothetical protein D3C76_757550 [compost metagenome]